jgi:exonuclease SbcC
VLASARTAVPAHARDAPDDALRALVREQRTALGELQSASARLIEVAAIDDRIAALTAELAMAAAGVAAARADGERATAELARAGEAQQHWMVAAADLGPATAAAAAADRVVELLTELALVRSDLADAEHARDCAVSDDHAAREHHLRLWERRLADIAGDLATQLVPGEACLVCGSCDHPAPASLAADHVGRAAVDAAAQAAQRAGVERQRAHERVAALRTRAGELAALTGGQDESAAAASLNAARARVADATAAVSSLEHETALAALALAQRDTAADRHQRLSEVASAADTSLTELGRQRSAIVADLDRLRGADADVPARRQRLEREAVAIESLLDALGTARVADRALAAAQRRLVAACARHGFPNEQEAAAAVLAPALIDDLSAAVRARDNSRAAQLAVLAEPELQGLEDLPEPQVELLQAEVTSADSELQRRRSEATLALDVVRRLAALARSVADHDDAAAPVRHEFDRVDQLTTCVLGTGADNQLRMRLSAYVLAARLEEVAAAATERLTAMSDGRYALVHSDERAKGGGRSGLGLRVVDAWTGWSARRRPCPGVSRSSLRSPSHSGSPTSSRPRRPVHRSRLSSSTRGSAHWTKRRWRR